ncbi:IS607 family element RNA-guided endonuclease TnpB [Nakamurella lactea]|uniref:IS607 family element RNA-guided endonuclease TnpB n=1 Tax=Nakamurella lactea TaxID=459515 RepID=UPI001B7FEF33|nr:IS607 family element RNA-guided endonuclease TnpB [Nakamurella lactea]
MKLRTGKQARAVVAATGGVPIPAMPRKDGTAGTSVLVDIGPDFGAVRSAIDTVTVLYLLFDGDADSYLATGNPGLRVPTGWAVTGAQFEVCWPEDPERASLIRSHFGARRKAYNWALGTVKDDMDARTQDQTHTSTRWTLADLRRRWNTEKDTVAPWWAANSKECYSSGITDLVQALDNWGSSKAGRRKGKKVGFPEFKSRRKDRSRVRFTTGAMRLEADRRTIVLPVIGGLRSKENTRRVQRHLTSGRARVLNMTLTQRWGRLFVSVGYALHTPTEHHRTPVMPGVRAGVDLGLRTLATVAYLDPATGETVHEEHANPAPLRATLTARRKAGRQMSRRIPGSHGHRAATATLHRLDRRAVYLRRETAHQLATSLARRFGEVVIEDLDIAAMKRSMGRRAFRRSVSDAALGMIRPMLTYKTSRFGSTLTVADRWFPSSQLHHGHTLPDGTGCRLESVKGPIDKHLVCLETGLVVDRDLNASDNLRDWPDMPVGAQLVPRPRTSAVPPVAGKTAGQTQGGPHGSTEDLASARKTRRKRTAARSEVRTHTAPGGRRNPEKGAT